MFKSFLSIICVVLLVLVLAVENIEAGPTSFHQPTLHTSPRHHQHHSFDPWLRRRSRRTRSADHSLFSGGDPLYHPTRRSSAGAVHNTRYSSSSATTATATLIARRRTKTKTKNEPSSTPPSSTENNNNVPQQSVTTTGEERIPEYEEFGPVGKTIAGVTQIVVSTALEFVSGYVTALFFGTVVGLPGFLARPIDPTVATRKYVWNEFGPRFSRMNSRSLRWAAKWGGLNAAFGGFSVAVKVIRQGEEDEWNQIFSSAAAGAFFARQAGGVAMLRGAFFYGGMIYVLNGGLGGGLGRARKNHPDSYTERPIDP